MRHLGFWLIRAGQLAAAHAALGDLPCAADHRLALNLAETMILGVPRAFALLSLGEIAEAAGDHTLALTHYQHALAAGEDLQLARLQRASQGKIDSLTGE